MSEATPSSNHAQFRGDLRPILRLIQPYKGRWFLATGALLAGGALNLALPQGVKYAIDDALVGGDSEALNHVLFACIGLIAILAVLVFIRHYLMSWLGNRVVAEVRDRTFKHLLRQPPGFFHEHQSGELVSRLTSDIGMLQFAVGSELSIALRSMLTVIGGIGILIWMNPFLSMIMLLMIPALAVGAVQVRKVIQRRARTIQDLIAEANAGLKEAVVGIETVQIFQAEPRESERYRDRIMRAFHSVLRIALARGLFMAGTQTLGYLALGLILYVGAQEVMDAEMTGGELSAFLLYTVMVTGSLMGLAGVWTNLQRAVGATGRIFDLLDTTPDIMTPENPTPLNHVRGELSFKGVSFAYPNRPDVHVLTDLNFTLQPGETVALVGSSGAGKSTIAALSQRFYDPVDGEITLDGIPLKNLALESIRNITATVHQDPVLFSGTIGENIAYGAPDSSMEDIQESAKLAHIDSFISGLPEGYDSQVGERGVKLSGGQRQRIAIARAMLANPKLLILDEATSHLDASNEEKVQAAMEKLMVGRTTLVIAHRLSTIRNADRILVIHEGGVAESGTHDELMEASGIYATLVAAQTRQAEDLVQHSTSE